MWNTIKGWLAPPVFEDEDKARVARIAYIILLTITGVAIAFPLIQFFIGVDVTELQFSAMVSGAAVTVVIFLLWTLHRGWVRISSLAVPLLMLLLYTSLFLRPEVPKAIFIGYASVIIMAGLLLGKRGIVVFAALDIVVIVAIFIIQNTQPSGPTSDFFANIENLPTIIANLIIMSVLYYVAISGLSGSLQRLRLQENVLNERNLELEAVQGTLEQRVADRTRGLEIVTTLSERLTGILDFNQLLDELVNQVKQGFGYYHVHIYILDAQQKNLVVAEGVGEAGAQMKAQNHQIALNTLTSLVARAARSGQVVNVSNVRENPDWLPNPLLPDTYSEMAVPIIVEGQVVGVLDVQEDKIAGFDEGHANLLRSLANQVAVAIRNARLFDEVETALAEAHAVQERYVSQAWSVARAGEQENEYLFVRPDMFELSEATLDTATQKALAQAYPAIVAIDEYEGSPKPLIAPVSLGGQTIGALQLHKMDAEDTAKLWTEQDLEFVETILDQVALTAENLRLFDETRERAGREATIREITDKLRAAPNLDRLLETATQELRQRLSASHAKLELNIAGDVVSDGNGLSDNKGNAAGIEGVA